MQSIQYLLIAVALTSCSLAVAAHRACGSLARELARFEADGAADRPGSGSYFFEYLNSRVSVGVPAAIIMAMAASFFIGYGVVYFVASNVVLVLLAVAVAYALLLNLDSFEALLFERRLSKYASAQVGRWELNFGRWAQGALRRGRFSLAALGLLLVALVPFASQLVTGIEWAVSMYVLGVYSVSDSLNLGPGYSSVSIVLIYVLSFVAANWALARAAIALRRRSGGSPSG